MINLSLTRKWIEGERWRRKELAKLGYSNLKTYLVKLELRFGTPYSEHRVCTPQRSCPATAKK